MLRHDWILCLPSCVCVDHVRKRMIRPILMPLRERAAREYAQRPEDHAIWLQECRCTHAPIKYKEVGKQLVALSGTFLFDIKDEISTYDH